VNTRLKICFLVFIAIRLSNAFDPVETTTRIFDWFEDREWKHWDTSYVVPYKHHWRFGIDGFLYNNSTHLGANYEGINMDGDIQSDLSAKFAISAGYRALGLSYTFDAVEHDQNLFLSYYDNIYGGELLINRSTSIHGDMDGSLEFEYDGKEIKLDTSIHISKGMLKEFNILLNTYLVFNNRKFSYPAALGHANLQKKSAGSIIAGFAYVRSRITVQDPNLSQAWEGLKSLEINEFNLGFGYAYNFAFHIAREHHFLFLFSALPMFDFVNHFSSIFKIDGADENDHYSNYYWIWDARKFSDVEIVWTFRNNFSYVYKNFFAGLNVTFLMQEMSDDSLRLENDVLISRLYVGVMF